MPSAVRRSIATATAATTRTRSRSRTLRLTARMEAAAVDADAARATLVRRLRTQGRECAKLGSTLYAELMERGAADVEAGGPFFSALAGHEHEPGPAALALRLYGGAHRLALEGRAP